MGIVITDTQIHQRTLNPAACTLLTALLQTSI
jgi:hypothetical protein